MTEKKLSRDERFNQMVGTELPKSLLGSVRDWIMDNMNPDEVFDLERLRKFVSESSFPEEVFNQQELHKWATENGYKKERKDSILSHAHDNGI